MVETGIQVQNLPNSLIIIGSKNNYLRNIYHSFYIVLVTRLLSPALWITLNDSTHKSAVVSNKTKKGTAEIKDILGNGRSVEREQQSHRWLNIRAKNAISLKMDWVCINFLLLYSNWLNSTI